MPSTDNFHRERTFSGELSKDDKCIPVRFQARLDESGDLCAIFEPISFSEDSSFILREWSKDGLTTFFKLTAESEDGVILSSDYLYFNSVGPHFDAERGRHYVLKPQFAQAAVEAKWAGAEASAWLIKYLRGFPCFRPLSHPSAWGTVTMRGVLDPTDLNELTGHVAVESAGFVSNAATWRLEAQKLLDHVRIVMSFAAGALIRSPAEEFRHGDQVAVMIRQCGSTSKAFLPSLKS